MSHYCDNTKLEACWSKWNATRDQETKEELFRLIYSICEGVVKNFKPRDEDEFRELTHEAFILTASKIEDNRLTFMPGRAPAFNLLTTIIFRQLYSLKNRDSRRKRLHDKYRDRVVRQAHDGGQLLEIS